MTGRLYLLRYLIDCSRSQNSRRSPACRLTGFRAHQLATFMICRFEFISRRCKQLNFQTNFVCTRINDWTHLFWQVTSRNQQDTIEPESVWVKQSPNNSRNWRRLKYTDFQLTLSPGRHSILTAKFITRTGAFDLLSESLSRLSTAVSHKLSYL